MNKNEKLISLLIGLLLMATLGWNMYAGSKEAEAARKAAEIAATNVVEVAGGAVSNETAVAQREVAKPVAKVEEAAKSAVSHVKPETVVTLTNAQCEVELSSWGAVVKSVTLDDYTVLAGKKSEDNPALKLDFSLSPLGAIGGVKDLPQDCDYEVAESGADFVVFKNAVATRRYTLKPDYRIELKESFAKSEDVANTLSLGVMKLGASRNDILSVDSYIAPTLEIMKGKVEHHSESEEFKGLLTSSIGGCGGRQSAQGYPEEIDIHVANARTWIAAKDRFFVTALVNAGADNCGFDTSLVRDTSSANLVVKELAVKACNTKLEKERNFTFFVGPKKQSLLSALDMRDVMEFGMWRVICYPMVWVLNLFNDLIPNYGIAIILLTILVRVIFWPLTRKSTISMRRMSEIQPKIKEIQAKYKGNPQRLQQETWALYRDNKVNPMASCLPMLIQIPVFIALFTVLRSAVELRYASFLWIKDLSEPEALFSSWFPFGGLNILPILMAVTMAMQSALTPSTGDKNQQRMMMLMMPILMLVMFYNFPSALSLYWTLSQVVSIIQMWWIRRTTQTQTVSAK